ncbi:pseudouridine synthase [Suttonella indologenes]|uniref:Dual-specificity RNA pseudouridine synthase RluA n=1 Tax=Suttonella indologenes TaxID=13276 RepID=A0A380MXW5_9GAMM|nr:pseudouridine synthase [Suttonella indologenes]SUO97430.1 Ribosomal large subunit pseudouridine synthase A [Suttonella indologenes]
MDIIFEDADIVVVNKPAGLLSVPGRGADKQDSVEWRIKQQYPGAMAAHRLDMATSGVLLVAKHKDAERYYKQCFAQRETEKTYQALCHGHIAASRGEIDFPLRCDWERRPRQMVCYEQGKSALTRYKVLNYEGESTRVALYPFTGRSHQLRVHLAEIGHPIIGDNLYSYPQDAQLPRLLLHAQQLSITDRKGRQRHFYAPLPF